MKQRRVKVTGDHGDDWVWDYDDLVSVFPDWLAPLGVATYLGKADDKATFELYLNRPVGKVVHGDVFRKALIIDKYTGRILVGGSRVRFYFMGPYPDKGDEKIVLRISLSTMPQHKDVDCTPDEVRDAFDSLIEQWSWNWQLEWVEARNPHRGDPTLFVPQAWIDQARNRTK